LGQLNSALEIIRGAGHQVPVVGLAKQFELIFVEGSSIPVELPRDSQALKLMQRIRDEAHRFAITYHRKLRRARNLKSELDNVAGGTVDETDWDIAYFFNQKWPIDFPEDWDEAVALLKSMFKKAGVDYDPSERDRNVYSVIVNGEVGRTIKREEALRTLADYIQHNKG